MIQFNDLKFILCPNNKDGNSKAEIAIGEYLLDIIKKPLTRTYKVKPFERTFDKKRYLSDIFPEYGDFPEFKGREPLLIFLNIIDKHNLSEVTSEIEEDIEDSSYE